MLEFCDITVRFGTRTILQNVSFGLPEGKLTVLLGPNGSGKSTLIGCVNQQTPFRGQILSGGRDLAGISARERAKQIAILPQTLTAPHITVWEQTALGRNPHLGLSGRLTEADRQIIDLALSLAGVSHLQDRFADTLSGGEQQRCRLAMILAQDTPILLLDEPTAHLDLRHEAEFLRLLTQLKEQQEKTVLVVLHDLTLAMEYADHLVILKDGQIPFAGSTEACLAQKILEKVFNAQRFTAQNGGEIRYFFRAK